MKRQIYKIMSKEKEEKDGETHILIITDIKSTE